MSSNHQQFTRNTISSSSFTSSKQSSSVLFTTDAQLKKSTNLEDLVNKCDSNFKSKLSLDDHNDPFNNIQKRMNQSFSKQSAFDDNFFQNNTSFFSDFKNKPDITVSQTRSYTNASVQQTVRSKVVRKQIKRTIVNGKVVEEEEEIDEIENEPATRSFQMENSTDSVMGKAFLGDRFNKKLFDNVKEKETEVKNKPKAIEGLRLKKLLKRNKKEPVTAGKIQHIINELLTTEENYVRDLHIIYEEYMSELTKEDAPKELAENPSLIFGNIEIIYMFHDVEFLTALKESEKIPEDIAKCFLKYKRQFSLYRHYNKNKPHSEVYLAKYGDFFKKKQDEIQDIYNIGSYLIKPTQRLCRYTLLMEDLAKECKKHKIPEKDVAEVVEMLKAETRLGNDLMALDAIKNCDMDLKDQGDLIYRDGFSVSKGSEPKYNAMVFLFEKIMLFTKKVLENNVDVLHYQDFIYLKDIGLTEMPNNPHKFEVWFHRYTLKPYTLETPNKSAKERWVNEIRKQLQLDLERKLKDQTYQKRTLIDLKNDSTEQMTFIP